MPVTPNACEVETEMKALYPTFRKSRRGFRGDFGGAVRRLRGRRRAGALGRSRTAAAKHRPQRLSRGSAARQGVQSPRPARAKKFATRSFDVSRVELNLRQSSLT